MDSRANMSQSHMFNVGIATEYGVYEAILLNNLYFWIMKNEANGKHYHDGHYWTYNSTKAFAQLFPYFSEKQVRTILGKLEKSGLLVTGNYNQSAYDRTKWYALTSKAYALFGVEKSIYPNGQMENPERANEIDQEGEPIPDSKPDIKPYVKPEDKREETGPLFPDANDESGRGKRKSRPKSREEVEQYIREMGYDVHPYNLTADEFLDACEQTGWVTKGGQPVKDWKARVRTFARNRKKWNEQDRRPASVPDSKRAIVTRTPEEMAAQPKWGLFDD